VETRRSTFPGIRLLFRRGANRTLIEPRGALVADRACASCQPSCQIFANWPISAISASLMIIVNRGYYASINETNFF
jgi:hypothetical protein